ncbi:uncharacterized protein [Solanum lycopersicum]|uniref:Uncharacterized protein n=1 Tax=Solanum lycopersicum TaxID=4081 RepID=A0A3Q7EJB5_SOLLC|nr:uncharacterized protein LOC104648672 [Solanum lycopersicum]
MWDWWYYFSFNSNKDNNNNHPYSHNLLPIRHENRPTNQNPSPISRSTMILTSWLNRRRFRRYFCLLLCSPVLLPLFCATCPIICAAEICYRLCYRRRSRSPSKSEERFDGGGGDGRGRCEGAEGSVDGGHETMLLRRYLDDQLLLVIESVYNCGDEEEDVEEADSRSLLLQ